ncbi:glycoside hydrolase family 43 protein [Flagelloscypha sp. PMI_526]|nr:glycoside hydrolase family 43 protein [Flagelloscypha sp. PMI_526]
MEARALVFTLCLLAQTVWGLINPILPGWNPDPSILRVGSDYFIATSSFVYSPGHAIYHSKNLSSWELIGHALTRSTQLPLYSTPFDGGLWAPALRYHKGTYYLITTARYVYTPEYRLFPRSFFVTTNNIFSNQWSEPTFFDSLGYDAELFWDTNGDVYSTWCGINNAQEKIYGIWQNKIDLKTGDSLTPAQLIFSGTLPLTSASRPEGPHVYYINSTYYLLIAEGGTDQNHRATIQRGPSPSGPWENNPKNPILFNGADLSLPVSSTGHADFLQGTDGNWYGVALGTRPQGANFSHQQLGRETFLFPVTWEDGWPVFNHATPISEHIENFLSDEPHIHDYYNDFNQHTLDNDFYTLRTPYKPFYSITNGKLRIRGNSYALGDRDSPALVLHKQRSYYESFETELDFNPTSNLTEAGITIFYSDSLHDDVGITLVGNQRSIVIRSITQAVQVGPYPLTILNNTIATVTYYPLQGSGPVKLSIIGQPTSYQLGYAEGNGTFTYPVTIDSSQLSVAPVGGFFFAGTAWGAYSTGTGKPTLVPADFSYWKQTLGNTTSTTTPDGTATSSSAAPASSETASATSTDTSISATTSV